MKYTYGTKQATNVYTGLKSTFISPSIDNDYLNLKIDDNNQVIEGLLLSELTSEKALTSRVNDLREDLKNLEAFNRLYQENLNTKDIKLAIDFLMFYYGKITPCKDKTSNPIY